MILRPFFKYFGSKWSLSARVPAPTHDLIIEPFAGSAGYACRYGADRDVLLLDTSPDVVAMWQWLITATRDDVMALPTHVGDVRDLDIPAPARRLIQGWLTTQGSTSNYRPTPMVEKVMRERPAQCQFWGAGIRARIAEQIEHIRHWRAVCAEFAAAPDVVATWCIDPPYQRNKHAIREYGCGAVDYGVLAGYALTRRGQVIVHEQAGADWLAFRYLATPPTGAIVNGTHTRQTEVVWIVPAVEQYGTDRVIETARVDTANVLHFGARASAVRFDAPRPVATTCEELGQALDDLGLVDWQPAP